MCVAFLHLCFFLCLLPFSSQVFLPHPQRAIRQRHDGRRGQHEEGGLFRPPAGESSAWIVVKNFPMSYSLFFSSSSSSSSFPFVIIYMFVFFFFFSQQSNSSRPEGLPPSQGGKYAGFGSTPAPSSSGVSLLCCVYVCVCVLLCVVCMCVYYLIFHDLFFSPPRAMTCLARFRQGKLDIYLFETKFFYSSSTSLLIHTCSWSAFASTAAQLAAQASEKAMEIGEVSLA